MGSDCIIFYHCLPIYFDVYYFQYMEFKDKPTNRVDPDEVAHNEPPHLDLRCLPSQTFYILKMCI